jgi:hypothetical protein
VISDPGKFVATFISRLPKELQISSGLTDRTDEELDAMFEIIQEQIERIESKTIDVNSITDFRMLEQATSS